MRKQVIVIKNPKKKSKRTKQSEDFEDEFDFEEQEKESNLEEEDEEDFEAYGEAKRREEGKRLTKRQLSIRTGVQLEEVQQYNEEMLEKITTKVNSSLKQLSKESDNGKFEWSSPEKRKW